MRDSYISKMIALIPLSLLGILYCNGQQLFTGTGVDRLEPVTVRASDRVSLYPSNGCEGDVRNFIYPNVVSKNGIINVFATTEFDIIEIISGNGVLLFQQNIKGRTGRFSIPLKTGPAGINYLRMRNKETMIIQKFVVTG